MEFQPKINLLELELSEHHLDKIFRTGVSYTYHRNITNQILHNYLDGCYQGTYINISKSYHISGIPLDMKIIETVFDSKSDQVLQLHKLIPSVDWIVTQYKDYETRFSLVVHDLSSLEESSKLITPKIKLAGIIIDNPTSEIIEWLDNNPDKGNLIDWNYLTQKVDHELIISYPELPWITWILSTRKYNPSTRNKKSARCNNYIH